MSGIAGRDWSGKGGRQKGSGLRLGAIPVVTADATEGGSTEGRDLPTLLCMGRRAERGHLWNEIWKALVNS